MDNQDQPLKSIAIVGQGLIAWAAAVTLAKLLKNVEVAISILILSDEEATESAVEVAQPELFAWLARVGLSESEVMARGRGLYTLGLKYQHAPDDFFLPYGRHGIPASPASFEHEFFRAYPSDEQPRFNQHFLATQMALRGRFDFPVDDPHSVKSTLHYGATVQSEALCNVLQRYAQALGVLVEQSNSCRVEVEAGEGIRRLHLSEDRILKADFYIDASGAGSRLLGDALGVPFEEEKRMALWPTRMQVCRPFNEAWQPFVSVRRIPEGWVRESGLQGQSVVECWLSTEAEQWPEALQNLGEEQLVQSVNEQYGQRSTPWQQNCLALGRAAGHPGDLLASEWHRACQSLLLWLQLYPDCSGRPALRAEFNRRERARYDGWFELHALHTIDSSDACQQVPQPLRWHLQMFEAFGRLWPRDEALLPQDTWVALLLGLGWRAGKGDILLESISPESIQQKHHKIYTTLVRAAERMPTLEQIVQRHCLAAVK